MANKGWSEQQVLNHLLRQMPAFKQPTMNLFESFQKMKSFKVNIRNKIIQEANAKSIPVVISPFLA
jgi:hypothetical protein